MDIRQKIHFLKVRLRRAGNQVGRVGALAAGLVVLAAIEYTGVTMPLHESIADLHGQARRQMDAARSGRQIKRSDEGTPAGQLAAFTRYFPPASDANVLLGRLHDIAAKENLVLERGEYRLVEEASLDVSRYQITLPVRGTYASIVAFVTRTLREMPSVTLDGVSLQRPNVGEPGIEAQLRLSLFVQAVRP